MSKNKKRNNTEKRNRRMRMIRSRDGDNCIVCGYKVPERPCPWPLSPTIEHIVPFTYTIGAVGLAGVAISHHACNQRRGLTPLPLNEWDLQVYRSAIIQSFQQWEAGKILPESIAHPGQESSERIAKKQRRDDARRLEWHADNGREQFFFGLLPECPGRIK